MTNPDTPLQHELDDLRRQHAALQQQHAALQAELERQRLRVALMDTLLANLPIVVYTLDGEGRFTFSGGKGLEAIQLEENQFIGMSLFDLYPPESTTVKNHRRALDGESLNYVTNDNGVFYEVWLAPLTNTQGRPAGVLSVALNVDDRQKVLQELHRNQTLLQRLIDNLPAAVAVKDREGRYVLVNQRTAQLFGLVPQELIGKTPADLGLGRRDQIDEATRHVLEQGTPIEREIVAQEADGDTFALSSWFPIHDNDGQITAIGTTVVDITAARRAELERARFQEQIIQGQQAALRELSTPLIPLADHVVVMPLVGSIDSHRAQLIMETLLEGISTHQADVAILDITGVPIVDTQVADALLRTARAARLLGAQVILTGIGGHIAQTLITLGADLTGLVTLNNLQSGITYALQVAQPADEERGRRR
ncbi:MAG: hypothetical protein OHK0022_10730 [Roseiflexaceae bacterium]